MTTNFQRGALAVFSAFVSAVIVVGGAMAPAADYAGSLVI